MAGSIGDAGLRRLGGAGVALALLLGAAPVAAGVAMVGPHATGGFHTHRLGRATVWRISAPHLRLARPGPVWQMGWRCTRPGERIVAVSWDGLRYAAPSGLALRVIADGNPVWEGPDAWLPPSPAPGEPFRVGLGRGACDVTIELVQVQAREQQRRVYWIGNPAVRVLLPRPAGPGVGAGRLLGPERFVRRHRAALRWVADPRADYYNVQLFRNGRKVLSSFPSAPRAAISAGLLVRGAYVLRVWSGLGRPKQGRYAPRPWLSTSFRLR